MVKEEFYSYFLLSCVFPQIEKKNSEELFSIFCDVITSGSVTSVIKILFAFLEIQISISEHNRSETSDSGSYPIESGNSLSYSGSLILRLRLIPCNHCYTLGYKVTHVLEQVCGPAEKNQAEDIVARIQLFTVCRCLL